MKEAQQVYFLEEIEIENDVSSFSLYFQDEEVL